MRLFFAISVVLIFSGCNSCNRSKSREKPDVSGIKIDIHLLRFDRDFFDFRTKDFAPQADFMRQKYGPFFDFYVNQIVIGPRPGGDTSDVEEAAINKFLADPYIQKIQDSINFYFADTRDIEKELTQSFKYFKYYFPEVKTPTVIAVNSGFALGAFTYGQDVLGIGLDLYFGPGNVDYDSAGIFQYLQHKMSKGYIARNGMEALYNLYFGHDEVSRGETLIEGMADAGKKMYFLSRLFPDAPDSMLVGFTAGQTRWCEASEYEIWKFLNDKDMLYKSNYMDLKRYLDEGPTTPGMPAEAPGNIGSWIGLQMVRKFMTETDDKISLHDLITKYDAKAILAKARYRPSKPVF